MAKLLFGIHDVLTLDAWLDHFESSGHTVDGAMTAADILGTSSQMSPDYLIAEHSLIGESDGLAVFNIIKSQITKTHPKLIIIVPDELLEYITIKRLNNNFVQSGGIKAVIPRSEFNFESVEHLINTDK